MSVSRSSYRLTVPVPRCPRCESRDVRPTVETAGVQYFRCSTCGHIWSISRADPIGDDEPAAGVNRLTAHGRTTSSEDVILGTGHLWQNGECVAAVHYMLVGSVSPNDVAGAPRIESLMGVVRFADDDSARADGLLHSGDLALQ